MSTAIFLPENLNKVNRSLLKLGNRLCPTFTQITYIVQFNTVYSSFSLTRANCLDDTWSKVLSIILIVQQSNVDILSSRFHFLTLTKLGSLVQFLFFNIRCKSEHLFSVHISIDVYALINIIITNRVSYNYCRIKQDLLSS